MKQDALDNKIIHKEIGEIRKYLDDKGLDNCTKQAILEGALGVEKAVTNAEILQGTLTAMMSSFKIK